MKGLILTYTLCYGGSFVSIFNPFPGLLIYFAFALITPESLWYWAVKPGHYSRIIAIAMLIGWVLKGFGDLRLGKAKWPIFSITAFWVWALFTTQTARVPMAAWNFCETFAKILLPIIVGITLLDSLKRLKQLAWTLAIAQGYVAYEFNRAYAFDGFNWVTWDEGYANLDNNSLCIAMVCASGLCFFLGLRATHWWKKWPAFFFSAMLAHVTMFGDSRGGMLGLVIMGIVSFFIIPKQPKHYLIFLLAVIIALRLAGPYVVARFATIFVDSEKRDASATSRLDLWKDCLELMVQYPLMGVGADNWPHIASEFGWPAGKEAHSLWLQIGAEMGLPGLFFLLFYYLSTMWMLWKMTRQKELDQTFLGDVARMVIAALTGFGCSAMFVSLEGLELPYYVCLLGAGALKLASLPPNNPEDAREFAAIHADAQAQQPVPRRQWQGPAPQA